MHTLRQARRLHRWLGVGIGALALVSALTGLALGWKKQADWLQPGTQKGSDGTLADWRPLSELKDAALVAFRQNTPVGSDPSIDRMDVRPGKNTIKVRFEYDDLEIQIDGITGAVLHAGRRNADWIERIHDGSFISEGFKLVSMNTLGLGLTTLVISGAWLYFGPKKIRARKRFAEKENNPPPSKAAGGDENLET